jgi:hypothetical protein
MTRSALNVCCLVFGALFTSAVAAHAGSPLFSRIVPGGGQRGTELEVSCEGTHLEDATGLIFYDPGFEVLSVSDTTSNRFKAKIKIAPDAEIGEHLVRVLTASGVGELRTFYVTPYRLVMQAEKPKNPAKAEPQVVELNSTIAGHLQGEDVDRYAVELKKGQRVSAEVVGVRLQPRDVFDSMLTVTKADGTKVIECDDSSLLLQDPVLSFIAPEDGKYTFALKDSTNAAPGLATYLLHIGSFPRPLAVYPPGGQKGEKLTVTFLGDAAGPFTQEIQLPDKASESHPLFPEQNGAMAPSPNNIRVSDFPNVLEVEPNNDWKTATPSNLPLPLAFNGVISEKGDIDFFKFYAKKGEEYDLTVYARRLRSPLDSVLAIYDGKGNRLALNDDSGSQDSYLRFKVPADGDYELSITDQLGHGGPTYTYRVEVAQAKPEVAFWLPTMIPNTQERMSVVVPKGNRYAALLRAKRENFSGDLAIMASQLPPGVTMTTGVMQASVDGVPVVFEATEDAKVGGSTFTFQGKSTENKPLETSVAQTVDVVNNGNQKPFYAVVADKLAIGVSEEAPFKLRLVEPKAPIAQSGSMTLKVIAELKPDFKGPITLALIYAPPGIGTGGTSVIKEGENEGTLTLSATTAAPIKKWQIAVVGSTDSGTGNVWASTQLSDMEVVPPFVEGKIARTFVDQGDKTTISVKIDQKTPFEGKAKIVLLGLPNKVTAEEKEFTKDDTEVKFDVQADKTSPAGRHAGLFCQVTIMQNGEPILQSIAQGGVLRVDPATVAKADVKDVKADAKEEKK